MFRLPTSNNQGSFLLFDRSAMSVATALLLEDLDDRLDTLRGALENDPLLATWTVNEAACRDNLELRTVHKACRWLEQRFLPCINPLQTAEAMDQSKATRVAWHSIVTTSVNIARRARDIASRSQAARDEAYWLALLCSFKRQVDSLAKLNGHSPLPEADWTCAAWLDQLDHDMQRCTEKRDARYAGQQAIVLTSSTNQRWLDEDAATELTKPYPEAKRLVPAVLKNLQRMEQLEANFSEALHREKMAAMQQLAYGASHEINNPLANISTRAQSLVQHEHDADRRRKLLAINDQAFRAYEMIADLMLFAKPPKLQIQSVHLNQLVGKIRNELEAATENVVLQIETDDSMLLAPGDETHLAVAIKSICRNGIEAMGNQGTLHIRMYRQPSGTVAISIADSGQGLSDLARRHLFDPFFSGREAGRGMGFGLSKAWRIIEQHHGRISVTSIPSQGSCFTITLPTESTDAQI